MDFLALHVMAVLALPVCTCSLPKFSAVTMHSRKLEEM